MSSDPSGIGLVKTFFVFTDLPKHIEYRALPMPLMPEGVAIRFDTMRLMDPTDQRRVRKVEGGYRILNSRLVYNTSLGLLQYLELAPE